MQQTVGKPEMQSLLAELLAGNRGPGYGIEVTAVGAGRSHVDVTLTFVSGRRYCCSEPFCNVPIHTTRLLDLAARRGIALPTAFEVRWHVVVEAGVLLACFDDFAEPPETVRHEYDAVTAPRA